jgi:hypothetical protein
LSRAYSHRRALRRQRIGVRLSFLAEYIQTIVTLVEEFDVTATKPRKVSLSFLMPAFLMPVYDCTVSETE